MTDAFSGDEKMNKVVPVNWYTVINRLLVVLGVGLVWGCKPAGVVLLTLEGCRLISAMWNTLKS